MVKEIERFGIPIIHMSTITTISQAVGANRIVPTIAIPYPVGNPSIAGPGEEALRRELVVRAVKALGTSVEDITIFE
ncbi:selenoprotein B, glycine/betaine/sarcosine/D-proline reductase family [Acidaminobacter hydrogenoformans DSM 2784]|nr:selenoprotein B, glycine/betaine/sarcosine/D-proline reductase family [Acidaminobacter hydrogenoformans DSM 2784]